MEDFLRESKSSSLDLPPCEGQNTIFEYFVSETGCWAHWNEKVWHALFVNSHQQLLNRNAAFRPLNVLIRSC